VLLFERPGYSPEDYARWSDRTAEAGLMLCVPTRWTGDTVLRLAFVNPNTRADEVLAVLDTLRHPAPPAGLR